MQIPTTSQVLWIAIAYQCLIRAGDTQLQAEATIGVVLDSMKIARSRMSEDVLAYAHHVVATMPVRVTT